MKFMLAIAFLLWPEVLVAKEDAAIIIEERKCYPINTRVWRCYRRKQCEYVTAPLCIEREAPPPKQEGSSQ